MSRSPRTGGHPITVYNPAAPRLSEHAALAFQGPAPVNRLTGEVSMLKLHPDTPRSTVLSPTPTATVASPVYRPVHQQTVATVGTPRLLSLPPGGLSMVPSFPSMIVHSHHSPREWQPSLSPRVSSTPPVNSPRWNFTTQQHILPPNTHHRSLPVPAQMSPRVVSSVPITRTSTQPSATQQVLSSALSTGGGSSMKGGTQKDQKEVHISQEVDSPMETREPQVEPSTFPATGLSSFSAIRRPPPLPVRASLPAPSHGATPPSSLSKTRTNVPRAIITFSKAGEADETETDTLRERGRESPVASPAAAPATFPVMPPRVPLLRDRRRVSPRPAVRGGMEIPSGREISPLSLHATDPSPSLSPSSAKGLSGRERDRVEGGDREKYFGVSGEMSMSRSSLADRDRSRERDRERSREAERDWEREREAVVQEAARREAALVGDFQTALSSCRKIAATRGVVSIFRGVLKRQESRVLAQLFTNSKAIDAAELAPGKWVATERLKGALKTRLASEVAAAFGRLQQWTSENRAHSSLRELEKERRALIASVEEASVRGVQQEQSLKELSGLVTNLRGQASHAHELFGQATLARRALACEAVVRTIRKRVQGSFTKMREQLRGGGGSRAERQRVAAGVLRRTLMAATQRHVALAWKDLACAVELAICRGIVRQLASGMRLTQHMTDLALFEAMETPHEAVKGKGKEGKGKALDMRRKQGSADGDVKGNRGVMSRLLALASALEAGPRGGSGTEGEGDSGSMVSALESAMAAALGPSGGVLSLTDSDSLHTGPEPDIVSVVSVAVSPSGSPKRDGKGKRPGRIVSAAAAVLGSVPSRQRSPKSPKNNASPQKVVRTTTTVISPPPLRFPPPPLLLPAPLPIRIPPTVSVTRVSPPPPPLLSPHTVTVTTPPPPPLRIIHTAPSVSVATPPRRVSAVSPPPPPPICISPGGFSPPPPPPLCILSPSVPQLSPASAAAPKETATQPAVSSTVRVSSPEPPRTVVRNNPAVFSFSSSNQPTFSPPVRVICSPPPVIYANPPPATSILTTPLVRPAPPPLISKTILCCTPPTATSPLLPQQLTPVTTIYEGPPQLTPVLRPHTPPAPCIQPLLSTTMPKSPVSPKSAAALLRERNLREREVALLKEVRRDHALLASAPQPTASDTAGPGPSSGTDSSCLSMRARATVTATASAVSVCLSRDDLERRRPPADSVRKSPKNRKGSPVMSLLREEVRGRTEGLPRAPLPMMPVESLERSLSMKPPGPGGPRKGKRHCRVVPGRKIGPTGRP